MPIRILTPILFLLFVNISPLAKAQATLTLENQHYKIVVEKKNGAMSSFLVKQNNADLIKEKRLMANFRINLQLEDDLSNYIDGMQQHAKSVTLSDNTITATFSGMSNEKGNYPIDLAYYIKLKDDYVSFDAKLTNNDPNPIAEFWFPRIGGWKDFGSRDAKLAVPGYDRDCKNSIPLFKKFPGMRFFGAEAAEYTTHYPGMVMPWWNIYDEKSNTGLYLGYQDPIFRFSTWQTYVSPNTTSENEGAFLTEEQAAGQPVGLTFSHVFYPFIHSGETFDTGEFIVRAHEGDWHGGAQFYRKWFMAHFPFDNSNSWLRKKSAWFSSILAQPEDKIIADYETYNQWTKDAKKYGIDTYELIGWDSGGLERDYPIYKPSDELGGRAGFKSLLADIKDRGEDCLVFVNYNILDQNTDWYKNELHKYMAQDQFGKQNIRIGWGQSTLLARQKLSVRYHVRSSLVPGIEKILHDQFVQLVKDGAQALQIDKLVSGFSLDFNPLNTAKPDVALCEGLVQSIDRLNQKCLEIDPDFRMASEVGLDRLVPYFDVGYRNSFKYQVSPLRYVFPEWTSCQHIIAPRDFRGINGAAVTGSVICVEPETYQGSLDQPLYHDIAEYIQEVERIRKELTDIIFLGTYYDNLNADVVVADKNPVAKLHYKVWGDSKTDKRAIVVANDSSDPAQYLWKFENKDVKEATLYVPFKDPKTIKQGETISIDGVGLHFIVEK